MKLFMVANLSILVFWFGATTILQQTLFSTALTLPLFFFLNYWLVPGGFAWSNYQNSPKGPKLRGPVGWPVLGFLPHQMGSLAHQKLSTMATSLKATRLMAFSLGTTRVIISSHPDTAREILGGSSFSDRPIKQSAKLLMFERAIGFAPSGTYWRHLRRIAAVHMFSPRRIGGLEALRQKVTNEMIVEIWDEMKENRVVGLKAILQKGSLSNIIESVFGTNYFGLEEKEGSSTSNLTLMLHDMVKQGYDLISRSNLEDYFPLRFLDFYGVRRKCHKLAAEVNCVVGQIVRERKRAGDFSTGNDFLSALLALPQEDKLTDSDMVAILWEMIFRGTDTVAILLEWIMARIVLHPDIQAKAHQELDTHVGNNRHVRDSDLPNLPYLQAIVKEVLRMHPPGPLLSWARLAVHDVHVDKVFIPAGTTAMVNMWAITHDPSIWKDPSEFRPERFIEEDVSIMGSDLRLAPFGSGKRVCPGKALGLTTVHLWLARLLHKFKWFPAEAVDLSECLRLSLEMKKPLACRVVPRGMMSQ
ncbi:cytochrome P450 78A5-like [Prunus yedoensis var. nudiflora]|uniref:Cytochrome P450 78A5-like n=1 Tax=Prunus yedoensis var. nudiflora TaxID=2094558 RepID=A0A314ZC22_PRUYE|nr:cytochrome P450 78A5-like [Prunus yedoensis var. nudiflora]